MGDILNFLTQYPVVLILVGVIVVFIVIFILLVYLVAFFQGREISFWPPKIGAKPNGLEEMDKTQAKVLISRQTDINPLQSNNGNEPVITEKDIHLGSSVYTDCDKLNISPTEILKFVLGEADRHPLIFSSAFSSLPLIYMNYVLLISWDGSQIIVERLLNREVAYPLNDAWFVCVSLYRQATTLPYRIKRKDQHTSLAEFRRSVSLFKKLVRKVEDFLTLLKRHEIETQYNFDEFEGLIDEAEFSIINEDTGTGIVRLEALLSTLHKLLISFAPQSPLGATSSSDGTQVKKPGSVGNGPISVLLVDDSKITQVGISSILQKVGLYKITSAFNSTEAMRLMIENDYDVIITDLVMILDGELGKLDGREVALAAKTIMPRAKVMLMSAYGGMLTEVEQIPFDVIKMKEELTSAEELHSILQQMLDEKHK